MVKGKQTLTALIRTSSVALIIFILSGGFSLTSGSVLAANITQRSLTISTSTPSATASYTFGFVPGTAGAIQGLEFQACTTAIGTCTAPTGLSFSSAAGGTVTGWTNATNFTVDGTGANNCIAAANILCAKRTQTGSEAASGVHSIAFTNITNPSGASCSTVNCTFFVRVSTYNLTTYTTASLVDAGTVASSTTQTLTLNAAIQEQLAFCIGNTTADTATAAIPTCSTITGTSVNLGNLTSADTSVSPISSTYNGNGTNGLAELTTNAFNGAAVSYNSVQQSGTNHQGALRVIGASCNSGNINTDQCITSVGTTKAQIVAGTEDFGMAIAGIDCSNVSAGSAYTCTYSSGTFNLDPATNYNCNGNANGGHANTYPTDSGLVSGTTACSYAWDESGSSNTIASSTTIVGGEGLILKFAATPNLVTPTGAYTAQANFIATPTF